MVDFENGKEVVQVLVERFGSKSQVARELNMNDKYLRRWERGETAPSAKRRVHILCLLDTDDPNDRLARIKNYAKLVESRGYIWEEMLE